MYPWLYGPPQNMSPPSDKSLKEALCYCCLARPSYYAIVHWYCFWVNKYQNDLAKFKMFNLILFNFLQIR